MELDRLITELSGIGELSPNDSNDTIELVTSADVKTIRIDDVVHDSRTARAGTLFCAVPGLTVDGHDYVASAIEHGASAALVERPIPGIGGKAIPQLRVANVRRCMAHAAAIVHGHPSNELALFGITGTNGKTTTTMLLADIMRSTGTVCSVIGTLDGIHTTPESTELQRHLRSLVNQGVRAVALEVSSHALDQARVDASAFAVAAFSNLTPDHLDYHGDMDAYFEAKARFFDGRASAELINIDDPWGQRLADRRPNAHKVSLNDVEIRAEHMNGTDFIWRGQPTQVRLPGQMNVANALMAAEAALLLGASESEIAVGLTIAAAVAGRMETVGPASGEHPTVVVDYSHTPDSIERALSTLRMTMVNSTGSGSSGVDLPVGQLVIVFGCGGDRDKLKRPLMGAAAEQGADLVYLTSDNPRTEDPEAIIADALTGFKSPKQVVVELDRERAIERAIINAGPGDVVLVAGKGHEKTQTIGAQKFPFDDVEVARDILKALET